jgi:hypothetical protein
MLDALVPQGTYAEIARVVHEWYGEIATRINFPLPRDAADDPHAARAIAELRSA